MPCCPALSNIVLCVCCRLDNVLIANPGISSEAAVLTDFGMCLDLVKNRINGCRVPMPYDGIRRGGAPIALPPEVVLPKPGPDVFLDYSKTDEWGVGMIAHELLSNVDTSPFPDMEHPATYSDAGYREDAIPRLSRPLVSALLRVSVSDRLAASDACRRAKRLERDLRDQAPEPVEQPAEQPAAFDALMFTRAHPGLTVSEGGVAVEKCGGGSNDFTAVCEGSGMGMSSGRHFAEFEMVKCGQSGWLHAGLSPGDAPLDERVGWGKGVGGRQGFSLYSSGQYNHESYSSIPEGPGISKLKTGDKVGLLLDSDAGTLQVFYNGTLCGTIRHSGLREELFWAATIQDAGGQLRITKKDPSAVPVATANPMCWNAADCHPGIRLSAANTKLTYADDDPDDGNMLVRGNVGVTRGVHYWETTIIKWDSSGNGCNLWGVATMKADVSTKKPRKHAGPGVWAVATYSHLERFVDGRERSGWDHGLGPGMFRNGTKIGVLLDMEASTVEFVLDGKFSKPTELPRGEAYFPVMGVGCLRRNEYSTNFEAQAPARVPGSDARLTKGDQVVAAPGMTAGPLRNGVVGVIIEDDRSGVPYNVRANGDTHWYKADQVRRAPGSSSSGAFTVSGAGMPRFNGSYAVDGTKSGVPSYRKVGSDETVERNGGKWYFCVDYGSSCYYKQTSGGDKPPERGWERAMQGEGSPPSLTYVAGGTATSTKVEWDSSQHGKGTPVMRKSDGRTGVSTMNRDSDGDIKIKFDDNGQESGYIKTRDVWVLASSGAASVPDVSGAVSMIKNTLGDVCSTWSNAGWDDEDEYSSNVRSGLARGPTESNPCVVAKGLSDSKVTELVAALGRTALTARHGLQAKRVDGSRVAVFLNAGAAGDEPGFTVAGAGSAAANGYYAPCSITNYAGAPPYSNGTLHLLRWERRHWVITDLGSNQRSFEQSRWLYAVQNSDDVPPLGGWETRTGSGPAPGLTKGKTSGSGPLPLSKDCRGRHGLTDNTTPRAGYSCDICHRDLSAGTRVHSCRQCNHDVCHECFVAGGAADAGTGRGSGGNSFETAVVGQLVEHGRRKAELLGFRCDRRGGRNGDTSMGCQNANGACRLRYLDNGEKYNVMHRDLTFIAGSGGGVASPAASLAGQRVDSSNISIGLRVQRGPDWHYGDQDGCGGSGKVLGWVTLDGSKFGDVRPDSKGWAKVQWDSGGTNSYEIGADGDYCLNIAGSGSDSSDP